MKSIARRRLFILLPLIALSLLAAAIVLLATPNGVRTTSDSVNYIVAARSLQDGAGVIDCFGEPMTLFAPLYPAVLSSTSIAGSDPFATARWLNAVTFALIVLASGVLFYQTTRSTVLALLAAAAATASWALMFVSISALSEPLFVLLLVLALIVLHEFVESPDWRKLVVLAVLMALAWLDRYLGIVAVAGIGVAVLALTPVKPLKRLQFSIGFGIIAALPTGAWLLRNHALTGALTGGRVESLHNLHQIPPVIVRWFVPTANLTPEAATAAVLVALFGFCVLVALATVLIHRKVTRSALGDVLPPPLTIFLTVYLLSFMLIVELTNVSIDDRMLSPIYVPLIALVVTVIARIARAVDARRRYPVGTLVSGILLAGWIMLLPAQKIYSEVRLLSGSDALGFSSTALRDSPQVQWVIANPQTERWHSNWAFPLCLHADVYARNIHPHDPAHAAQTLIASGRDDITLVIFHAPDRRYRLGYTMTDLASDFTISPVFTTDEGTGGVYRLTRQDNRN